MAEAVLPVGLFRSARARRLGNSASAELATGHVSADADGTNPGVSTVMPNGAIEDVMTIDGIATLRKSCLGACRVVTGSISSILSIGLLNGLTFIPEPGVLLVQLVPVPASAGLFGSGPPG